MKINKLKQSINKAISCRRCNCTSCERNGIENHAHECIGGPACLETPTKLKNEIYLLRLLLMKAKDLLPSADTYEEQQEYIEQNAIDRSTEILQQVIKDLRK